MPLIPAPAYAHVFVIRPDGSGDAPTFQAGVDSIQSGFADTLLVMPGWYDEAVVFTASSGTVLCPAGPESTWVRSLSFVDLPEWSFDGLGIRQPVSVIAEYYGNGTQQWHRCHFRAGLNVRGNHDGFRTIADCRFGGNSSFFGGVLILNHCEFYDGTLTLSLPGNYGDLNDCWFHDCPGPAIDYRVSEDYLQLDHCLIDRAEVGVWSHGPANSSVITETAFRHIRGAAVRDSGAVDRCTEPTCWLDMHSSRMEDCGAGVECLDYGMRVRMDGDTLCNLRGTAIRCRAFDVHLSGVTVDRIGGDGADLARLCAFPYAAGDVEVVGCTFEHVGGAGVRGTAFIADESAPHAPHIGLSGNVCLDDAAGGIVVTARDPVIAGNVIAGCGGAGLTVHVMPSFTLARIDSNTVVGNRGAGVVLAGAPGAADAALPPTFDRNLVAFNGGVGIVVDSLAPVARTNDLYRNAGGTATGIAPDPTWISADPLLCDPTKGDFHLGMLSPCAAAAPSGAIGALGVGCDAPSLDARLWWPGGPRMFRGRHEPVPLAILGSRYFDVTDINISSVRLAGAAPLTRGPHEERARIDDLDHDGHLDLLVWFDIDDLRLGHRGSSAIAEATTREGARYVGQVPLGPVSRGAIGDELSDAQPTTPSAPVFALMGATPNPSPPGPLAIHLSLPTAEPARLELLDIAGRRVRAMDLDRTGAGEWVERFEIDPGTPAGLYWLRLTQGAQTATARVVVLR